MGLSKVLDQDDNSKALHVCRGRYWHRGLRDLYSIVEGLLGGNACSWKRLAAAARNDEG